METTKETPDKKLGLQYVLTRTALAVAAVLLLAGITTGISIARGEQVAFVTSSGATYSAAGTTSESTAILQLDNGERVRVVTPSKRTPLAGTKTVVRPVNDNEWALTAHHSALVRPFETAPLALGLTVAVTGVLTLSITAYRSQRPTRTQ